MRKESLKMVDDEGENQAVRMFLALYGGACGVTVEQMRKHLKMAGFDGAWPEWASVNNGHLTKAGAQLWIRHLFALAEQPAPVQELVGWITQARCLVDAREFTEAEAKLYGWTPLYTSPQPAQRKPLTNQERSIIHAATASMRFFEAVEYAISKTEAAHGIKENT